MKNQRAFLSGIIVLPLALIGLGVAFASNVATPNNFVGGTTAMASEVNENFGAHADAINDNDVRINTLEDPRRPGTLLARVSFNLLGTVQTSWSSTGGAVTVSFNGAGDYVILVAGEDLGFDTHAISAIPVSVSNPHFCTFASAESLGFSDGLRIRVWDETGAAASVYTTVAIFNQ